MSRSYKPYNATFVYVGVSTYRADNGRLEVSLVPGPDFGGYIHFDAYNALQISNSLLRAERNR